jgi:hypothetical protein
MGWSAMNSIDFVHVDYWAAFFPIFFNLTQILKTFGSDIMSFHWYQPIIFYFLAAEPQFQNNSLQCGDASPENLTFFSNFRELFSG